MSAFRLKIHVDLYRHHTRQYVRGVADVCACVVPGVCTYIGPDRVLLVERVHWLGSNEFEVYARPDPVLAHRSNADRVRAEIDKILWLRFTWREDGRDKRPDGRTPPPAGGGDQRGPGQP